ncbi:MAG: hypothetical protein JNM56_22475 [Planctomycetia bacterium]|nr:hypothetical protein [Planctomycetia bacterium]
MNKTNGYLINGERLHEPGAGNPAAEKLESLSEIRRELRRLRRLVLRQSPRRRRLVLRQSPRRWLNEVAATLADLRLLQQPVAVVAPPAPPSRHTLLNAAPFTPLEGGGKPSKVSDDMRRRILAQATPEPKTSKKLARDAGYTYGSHTRAAVRILVRSGELVKLGQGRYCLPGKEGGQP